MAHSHSHHAHSHAPAHFDRAFGVGIALNTLFVIVEAFYGVASGSLSLVADAGHNLGDVLGLFLAWGATFLARKSTGARRTYGFRRASILASLFNAVLLLVATIGIVWEAIGRFLAPSPIASTTVMIVAGAGILINTATALLFASGRRGDLNIRGAYWHMASDAAVSAGVVMAALVISQTGWQWVDPLASLLIAGAIGFGTWNLGKEALHLALDGVPEGFDTREIGEFMCAQGGVRGVHHLHIWALSTTETALTAHIERPDNGDSDDFLAQIARELHDRFGIEHATLQIENSSCAAPPCESAPEAPNLLP